MPAPQLIHSYCDVVISQVTRWVPLCLHHSLYIHIVMLLFLRSLGGCRFACTTASIHIVILCCYLSGHLVGAAMPAPQLTFMLLFVVVISQVTWWVQLCLHHSLHSYCDVVISQVTWWVPRCLHHSLLSYCYFYVVISQVTWWVPLCLHHNLLLYCYCYVVISQVTWWVPRCLHHSLLSYCYFYVVIYQVTWWVPRCLHHSLHSYCYIYVVISRSLGRCRDACTTAYIHIVMLLCCYFSGHLVGAAMPAPQLTFILLYLCCYFQVTWWVPRCPHRSLHSYCYFYVVISRSLGGCRYACTTAYTDIVMLLFPGHLVGAAMPAPQFTFILLLSCCYFSGHLVSAAIPAPQLTFIL